MKVHKVIHGGKKVFCAIVETGEFYPSGRAKQVRFFNPLRNEAVAKAMDYLADKGKLPNKVINLDVYPLFKVFESLQEDWSVKVKLKNKNPKKRNTLSQDTVDRYEESVKALWKIRDKNTNIHTINKRWVDKFIKELKTHHTESHAFRVYSVFEKIMMKAEQLDIVDLSPTHAFVKDRPTYSSPGKKAIDPKEMKRILKQIQWSYEKYQSQSAFLLLIQAYTGARWGEVAALTHGDIDFKNNKILINKSRSAKSNTISLTKSGHLKHDEADMGERIVPIAPKFADMIDDYIVGANIKKDGFLFDCTYTVSQDTFIAACKRAGSTQRETKVFRRFVSTQMRKIGASKDEVKLRLGHSDIATQNIYVTHTDKNASIHAQKLYKTLNP